jgi:hypothetical protein
MPRVSGAGLHCGDDCEKEHQGQIEADRNSLFSSGFTLSEVPNVFEKDGVSLTLGEVKHVGIDKALVIHAQTVSELRSQQDSQRESGEADRGEGSAVGDGVVEPLRPASDSAGRSEPVAK